MHGPRGGGVAGGGDLKYGDSAERRCAEGGVVDTLGVEVTQDGEAGLENRGARLGVAGGEQGREIFRAGAVGAAGIEGGGDLGELGAGIAQGGCAWLASQLKGGQADEEIAGGGVELAQAFKFQPVNRGDAVEELLAGRAGFFFADVAEWGRRGNAHRGRLAGQDREAERGHAG